MKNKWTITPYLLWMAVFIIVPLGMVAYYAFTPDGKFSFDAFLNITIYAPVFLKSLYLAFIATVISLVLAYPLAYMMSRSSAIVQRVMMMLIMLPMWMNFLLRIYAWVVLLQKDGVIENILGFFGIETTLIYTPGAVVLGMVYNFLPYMLMPIYTVMTKIDGSLIEAASDLGSGTVRIFRKVVFPLSLPGVISGITMVFVPAASTFLVAQYLGGSKNMLIGDIIEKEFLRDYSAGSALSLVLMVFMFIFIGITNKFGEDDMEGMLI
jgi:spermidine/putrescine transport system permease protein